MAPLSTEELFKLEHCHTRSDLSSCNTNVQVEHKKSELVVDPGRSGRTAAMLTQDTYSIQQWRTCYAFLTCCIASMNGKSQQHHL